jgi:uncharacterized RDD family membrane protein YckC
METTFSPVQSPPKSPPVYSPTLASRNSRLLAAIIDWAAVIIVLLGGYFIYGPLLVVAGIMGLAIYQIYLLTTQAQTIGKNVMGIKIIKCDTGDNGGFVTNVLLRMVLNSILCFVPPYLLIDVLFIFRKDQCCIHDMIAGTRVVEA